VGITANTLKSLAGFPVEIVCTKAMRPPSLFLLILCLLPPSLGAQQAMVWQQRTTVGSPGLYEGAAMAFDGHQGVTLLFGGDKSMPGVALGMVSNDLWQYNGTTWQQVAVTGPLPQARSGHSMVYDPVDERVLMFGGDGGGVALGDLWAFEFSGPAAGSWVQLATLPSAGRLGAAMGYDAARNQFIVTGGIKQGTAEVEPPNGGIYGLVKPATRETWLWDRTAWSAGPPSPEYINGPIQNDSNYFIEAGPAGGVVAHHTDTGKTLLLSERTYPMLGLPFANYYYGGGDSPLYDGVQWGFNMGGNVSVLGNIGGNWPGSLWVSSPTRVVATYDPARRRVVAFGAGRTNSEEYDGAQWAGTATEIQGRFAPLPAARPRPCLAHDTLRGVTVFFGGKVSLVEPGDTWELLENPAAPFAITTDLSTTPLEPCQGEAFTLTGAAAGVGPFKWRWYRSGTFAAITATPILTLTNVSPAQAGIYTFEVEDSSGRRRTSSEKPVYVHAPPVVTHPPVDRRVVPGESFSLLVSVSSSLPETYQWVKDGFDIPGATSSIYTKSSAVVADGGQYKVRVTTRCTVVESLPCRVYVGPHIVTQPSAPSGALVMNGAITMNVSGDGVGARVGSYSTGSDPTEHPNRHAPDSPANPLPMNFVWRHEGVPLSDGTKYSIIATATTSQISINNPDYEDEGMYDCVVTDASGQAYARITNQSILVLRPLAPPYLTIQQGRGPDPRTKAGMVYDSRRGRTVLFGGECYGVNPRSGNANPQLYQSNDTFEWDGQVWIKRNPATRPPAMTEFGMVYDSDRGCTVLFGGHKYTPPDFFNGTQVITNDLWEWDGVNWTRITPPSSPPGRTLPVMCFDTARRETLMIGGNLLNPEPPDYYGGRKTLWAWNGTQWTQRGSLPNGNNAPYVNAGNTFAFDEQRGVAAMFGTFGDNENPVWEWNGAVWSRVLPPLDYRVTNSGTGNGTPFYDPVRRTTSMSVIGNNFAPGYESGTSFLVCWDGNRFVRGSTSVIDDVTGTAPAFGDQVPDPSRGDMTVFDTRRRCLVWFDMGGLFLSSGTPPSTREMHFSDKVKPVHQPCEVIFAANQTISLRAIHAGRRPLVQQWFKDGAPVLDDAHWSGAATATLRIIGTTAADAGLYTLRASNIHNLSDTPPVRLSLQNDGIGLVVQGIGLVLSWPGTTGILETAATPGGPWTPVHGVSPPYSVAMDEARKFFRVRDP
jgi:hypothetical protein